MEKFFKPLHLSGPQETPWLVFFSHGTRGKTQTFYSIVERRSYVKNLPEISRRKCMGYSHGWLIMNRWGTNDCSLLNPTTSEEIELPPLPPENEFPYRGHKCVVSSEPKEANCVVVWTNFLERVILFCNPGEKKWRRVEFELHETVTCMGKVYGITSEGSLVVLDFDANPTVKLIGIAPPTSPLEDAKRFLVITYFSRRKLVESRGEIFLVSREYLFYGDIKDYVMCNVYKVDFAQKKWVQVQSIGSDRAFFLCSGSSISCSASEHGVGGDCIYYVENEDPSLYRFDMVNRSTRMELPCPNLNKPWNRPHWIFL